MYFFSFGLDNLNIVTYAVRRAATDHAVLGEQELASVAKCIARNERILCISNLFRNFLRINLNTTCFLSHCVFPSLFSFCTTIKAIPAYYM